MYDPYHQLSKPNNFLATWDWKRSPKSKRELTGRNRVRLAVDVQHNAFVAEQRIPLQVYPDWGPGRSILPGRLHSQILFA
jgi:hypothetical protein